MSSPDLPTTLGQLAAFHNLGADLRDKAVKVLQECGILEEYKPGMTLFAEFDTDIDSGVVVLSGKFRVYKPDGYEIDAEGPELLGEMGVLSPSQRRTATVVAKSPIKALRFSWTGFEVKTKQMMTEQERETLYAALKEYAWNHFVG